MCTHHANATNKKTQKSTDKLPSIREINNLCTCREKYWPKLQTNTPIELNDIYCMYTRPHKPLNFQNISVAQVQMHPPTHTETRKSKGYEHVSAYHAHVHTES